MRKKTQGRTALFEPKPLDTDLFHTLFDILHDGCFEGNWSATARILDVSQNTVRSWSKVPPTKRWMNHVLIQAIKEVLGFMAQSKHKKLRKRAEKVRGQLHRAELHTLLEYIEYNENNQAGCAHHLLVELCKTSTGQLTTEQLRTNAIKGPYSIRSFRLAADRLQLDKHTQGFGKDKVTTYSLPYEHRVIRDGES